MSFLTNDWWDVQSAGIIWTRVERGVGLTVQRAAEGPRWSAEVSVDGMRLTAPPQSELSAARAWCDRWAAVVARELGR